MDHLSTAHSFVPLKDIQISAWPSKNLDQNHAEYATLVENQDKIGQTHIQSSDLTPPEKSL